ncbi:HK97 family phage prohead protease [Myxococcus landrumensis]|uniref:HK97 family phage prohead protease n=1 Tax=Myxococcus landrumensis TaxID=2813577 RepID=A0ABX7NFR9_9BACT|nr:HK97 family phage prohead protease [Myxococcus landrumus]QSQ17229.1 HK97 family phage prohead protease [Myxococcus landrumus]
MTAASPSTAGELPVFQACDTEVDRDGDRMLPGALKLEEFAGNPILYWDHGHKHGRLPVGTCRVWEEGGLHFMEPRISDATQESRDVKALVADGTIRACSIGYLTRRARPNATGGEDVLDAELVEVSLTGIPAKPKALRVKSMTPEEMAKSWKQLVEDMAETKTLVKALHAKAIPPEAEADTDEPAEEPTPTEGKSTEDELEEAPDGEEATVAKFFRSFTTK